MTPHVRWSPRFFNLLSFLTLFAGICAGEALQCYSSAVPPAIRAEGLAEYVGDYILACTGGVPTAAGQPVPQVTFTFTFNGSPGQPVNVTSSPTGIFSEALLIVDEPSSALNPNRPTLNCGAPGAPDNGAGPGTCAILSTGDPAATYDGTPNAYGSGAVCDGVGHPSANTYQCGRPNVFQGRNDAGSNIVQFVGVPFDPPGPSAFRYVRLANVRVNASKVSAANPAILPTVTGQLQISGMSVSLVNAEVQLASVYPSLYNPLESIFTSPILFREGFPENWRPRNLSAIVGDNLGTLGNGTYNGVYWMYNGGTQNPTDIAQNVPGAVYNTESGFIWQNNGPNRPPAPNPPDGFGYFPNGLPLLGGPLASAAYGGVDTGISTAGVAQAGTRLAIRFTNIPPGGSVTLPTTVQITRLANPTVTGVLSLTSTDQAGAGPYSPRGGTFTATDNLAVYEVLFSDPNIVEDANIPFTLAGFPDGAQLRGITSLAPFYSTTADGTASAALPEPRFLDPCVKCLSVLPVSGRTGTPVNTLISVNAALSSDAATRMLNGAQVKLAASGQPDIVGSPVRVAGRTLTATFNLAGAAVGPRDVVVTVSSGASTTIPGGFSVTAAPPCSYTVGPMSPNYSAAGGTGTLVVSPVPVDCAWSASASENWITLGAKQGQVQPYTVESNPLTQNRIGNISIAGRTVSVSQAGACTYQVTFNPANMAIPVAGGMIDVTIAAPTGCTWSTSLDSTDFMHATTATSGSGNGVVTYSVDANASALRTGYFSVFAGTTTSYTITQSGVNCVDRNAEVSVIRGAILSNFPGTLYTQQLKFTNTSGSPISLIKVQFIGITSTVASPAASGFACGATSYTVSDAPLAPGQSVTLNLQFSPGKSAGGAPPVYSTRIFGTN